MNKPLLVGLACLLAYGLALAALPQDPATELTLVLQRGDARRQEYVETFKDLTAVETSTTEIFDKNGKTEKRRTVVSDFLVYAWQRTAGVVSEYRVAREVDGKPVGKGEKEALELFEKLSNSKTGEQERNQLKEANMKYSLSYYRWGITLQPASALIKDAQSAYIFSLVGREKLGDREVVILRYYLKNGHTPSPPNMDLVKTFTYPNIGQRGQLWLDAEDSRIWKWESERTVIDRDIYSPLVYLRDTIEYVTSPFILVPGTITTSFFDKKESDPQAVRLAGRITNTYSAFQRFVVRSESEIPKIQN